jgi:hypothetical protein
VTLTAALLAALPEDQVGPGLLGFAVVFGLALATVLLIRSMVYHLRKVRYSPDPAAQRPADRGARPDPAAQHPGAQRPAEPADGASAARDGSPEDSPDDPTGGRSSGV